MKVASHPAIVALSAVLSHASGVAGNTDDLIVESLTACDWNNGCLELPRDGEVCTEAITPGFLVVLGGGIRYHADQHGNVRRDTSVTTPGGDTDIRVQFRKTGGFAGVNETYDADDSTLSPAAKDELIGLIDESDFFHLPAKIESGQIVSDGFEYSVTISRGRRQNTVHASQGVALDALSGLNMLIGWLSSQARSS